MAYDVEKIAAMARRVVAERRAASATSTNGVTLSDEQQDYVDGLIADAAEDETQAFIRESQEPEMAQLESLQAQVAEYRELFAALLSERVEALGAQAKTAMETLPESMSVADRLKMLDALESVAGSAAGDGVGTPRRPSPKPPRVRPVGPVSKYPIKL